MAALAEAQFRILRELAGGEPDPVQRGRTHRGAHGEGRAHPPAASPSPRSAPSSRNGPAPSAPGAASSSTAPGPSPCPPQAASPLRQGGARPPRRPPRPGARAPRPGVRPVRTLTRAGTPLPGLGPGAFVRIPGCTPPPPAATVPRGAHPPDPAILPSLSNQARPRSPYSPEFDPHATRRPAAHRQRPTGAANTPHQPGCTPPPPPTSTRRVRSAQYFHAYP